MDFYEKDFADLVGNTMYRFIFFVFYIVLSSLSYLIDGNKYNPTY